MKWSSQAPCPTPCILGGEGSGLVVATGSSDKAKSLLDQRVSFFTPGAYGEYCVAPANAALPLPDHIDYEQGSMYQANPLTVQGFLTICEENKFTSVASSAAASQVGKLLLSAATEAGITVVNFIRREAQVKILKDLGAEFVINRGQEGWEEEAQKVLAEQKVQVFFDALGGPDAGKIIDQLPNKAEVYSYGMLTGKPIEVGVLELIFKRKVVRGYYLYADLDDPERAAKLFKGVTEKGASGTFKSTVAAKFSQEQFQEALKVMAAGASKGKVLIQNPNFGE